MHIIFDKSTKAIIKGMIAFVILAAGVAWVYYRAQNKVVDPRVVAPRELYSLYNARVAAGDVTGVFRLLDSVEMYYRAIPHYAGSYERGVLYNNRAATLLTLAIHNPDSTFSFGKQNGITADSVFVLGEKNALQSIGYYTAWLEKYGDIPEDSIHGLIKDEFIEGLESYSVEEQTEFLIKRVEEMVEAQYENKRRLSVAYTNLGLIKRHNEAYAEAASFYQKALELWEDNLAAENNLNVLLGKPLKKRSFIRKLFPPKKELK